MRECVVHRGGHFRHDLQFHFTRGGMTLSSTLQRVNAWIKTAITRLFKKKRVYTNGGAIMAPFFLFSSSPFLGNNYGTRFGCVNVVSGN